MELRLKIGYRELLELIKQLPASQMAKLKSELSDEMIEEKSKQEHSDFQKFLLEGPVMVEDQYQQFLDHRKSFNQWRVN
jgi:hypothetical protein